jgi:hypothetical protein
MYCTLLHMVTRNTGIVKYDSIEYNIESVVCMEIPLPSSLK